MAYCILCILDVLKSQRIFIGEHKAGTKIGTKKSNTTHLIFA